MDERELKRGYRYGWLLVLIAIAFTALAVVFALWTNTPPHEPDWEMGGVDFVPASSGYAEGYYIEDVTSKQGEER